MPSPERWKVIRDKHITLLGAITHDWNFLEHQMQVIAWQYTKDFEAAHILTARLGNADLAAALLELCDLREERKPVKAAVAFLVSVFHLIRENRNALVHSHGAAPITRTAAIWIRKSRSKPTKVITATATLADLRELHASLIKARNYAGRLIDHLLPRGPMFDLPAEHPRVSLPRKFQKPRKMLQPRHTG
jgi:hypothetical protein